MSYNWQNFLGNGFGGDMIGMAFAGGASKTQGKWNRRLVKSENALARTHSIDMVKLGNELDMANQKEMFDYRIQQGREAGMTPYEMFMGPAAGAGGGTTGSGNTLGNQPAQLAANATQAANARMQAQTQLGTAMIQANAQRDVAKTQAEATTGAAGISAEQSKYNADLQFLVNSRKLNLDKQRFFNIDLPQAALNLSKTAQETLKLVNEVATSDPEYMLMMKRLTMAAPNVMLEMAINSAGFDPLKKDEVANATLEQKQYLMGLLLASQSTIAKEVMGTAWTTGAAIESVKNTLGRGFSDIDLNIDRYTKGYD
jgi:hypothetical protein